MALLPEGTTLPPLPHAAALALAAAVVGGLLARDRPRVDERAVLALAPWMAAGAALYVTVQVGLVPDPVAPLAASPTVYATVAVLAGGTWLAARRVAAEPRTALAGVGSLLALGLAVAVVWYGVREGTLAVGWPLLGFVVAAALAGVVWWGLGALLPEAVATTRQAGALVVFAHALDGVSTAVGYDVLGFGERTPLSRAVIELAAGLPTADLIGAGWLFVAVKLGLAVAVVWLIAPSVRETPVRGYLLLGLLAAVGLGPGVHNLLLFAVAG